MKTPRAIGGDRRRRRKNGFEEVLVPGEPEARAAEQASACGIELEESAIGVLADLGAAESVAFPCAGA